tara:strand:- start:1047 stop:1256 length:210 start_codon:yes stop_codon:yes gene_type:complete
MDKRMGKVEKTVEVHEHQIGELEIKTNGIESRLLSIEKTLMQIKYSLFGALIFFVLTEFGLLGAINLIS